MAQTHSTPRQPGARFQRGLTLIEFMISITLGMLIVAAVATLIADQSANRAEVDRSGRMIENGRYAVRAIADDAQLAGYWGELNGVPTDAVLAGLPDPCLTGLVDVQAASQLHIQSYNSPAPAAVPACVSNQLAGTDILVVRHADPDTSALTTGGVPDLTKLTAGQYYVQTGLTAAGTAFSSALNIGSATAATNTANFPLVKKDKLTTANVRKMLVRIYYVAQCSVENAGSCAGADNGSPIPTLKMIELSAVSGNPNPVWSAPVAIAEGIEQLQIDYGIDANADGAPDSDDGALTAANSPNVMAIKVHVVARALEKTAGFTDDKKYPLGTHGDYVPAAGDQAYKRHAFVQSVRLVNPSTRRQP